MGRLLGIVVAMSAFAWPAFGQEQPPPPPAAADAKAPAQPDHAPLRDAKFGIFFTWGVSSILEKGDWVMADDKIPAADYRKLLDKFNPEKFDAAQWAELLKQSGAKYVMLAAKHRDGFCLFDSKLTDYDVMSTPLKRDVVKELTDACRAAGLEIFFYYSLADWHHPDYWPWGWSGTRIPGRTRHGDNSKYIEYYQGQIRELCTNYGKIAGIWLDGGGDRDPRHFNLPEVHEIVRQLQPHAVVGNNRDRANGSENNFHVFGGGMPPNHARGPSIPMQVCDTIDDSWACDAQVPKPAREILTTLISAAGRGGNLLLRVSPLADGSVRADHAGVLREIGAWLGVHGKALYGTDRGPWAWREYGVSTSTARKAYLHLFERPGDAVSLSAPPHKLLSVKTFDGKEMEFEVTDDEVRGKEITLKLPQWDEREVFDFIINLTFEKPVGGLWIPEAILPDDKGVFVLTADQAELHGDSHERRAGWLWKKEGDRLAWSVRAPRSASYHAIISYSCPEPTSGCQFTVGTEESCLIGKANSTGTKWDEREAIELPGILELPAGISAVTIKATGEPKWAFMELYEIELRPVEAVNDAGGAE